MGMEFFSQADMLAKAFWLCAVGGTLFFVLRVIMMVTAGDLGDDLDGDVSGDHGSDYMFDIISVNSVTAFFMMFGWGGLTLYAQFGKTATMSTLGAFAIGVLSMYVTMWLFRGARKLVSRGADFKIEMVVGMNATVYQSIAADGRGKIHVAMPGEMTRELDAVSADKVAIASFQTVKIVSVVDQNTLSVRAI